MASKYEKDEQLQVIKKNCCKKGEQI